MRLCSALPRPAPLGSPLAGVSVSTKSAGGCVNTPVAGADWLVRGRDGGTTSCSRDHDGLPTTGVSVPRRCRCVARGGARLPRQACGDWPAQAHAGLGMTAGLVLSRGQMKCICKWQLARCPSRSRSLLPLLTVGTYVRGTPRHLPTSTLSHTSSTCAKMSWVSWHHRSHYSISGRSVADAAFSST